MDKDLYLARIGFHGHAQPNLKCLEALCQAHLRSVPFENFDIHLGVALKLDTASLFRKIVRRKRGGFCYELNGLFAWLLREIGFSVELLSSRVIRAASIGANFDHMALRVWCDGAPFLVDVGFGDGSTLPLALKAGSLRSDSEASYRLASLGDQLLYEVENVYGESKGYELSLVSRQMSEFEPMCRHHQTCTRSWFTRARICVLQTEVGTASLIDGSYKLTGHPARTIGSDGEYLTILREAFGIDLPRMPSNKSEQLFQKLRARGLIWQQRVRRAMALAGKHSLLPQ